MMQNRIGGRKWTYIFDCRNKYDEKLLHLEFAQVFFNRIKLRGEKFTLTKLL